VLLLRVGRRRQRHLVLRQRDQQFKSLF
jgi:hypothetical protein